MPVTATDISGSPTGGYDNRGLYARRIVRVDWDDIDAFAAELMPASISYGGGIIQYPGGSFSTGNPNLRVSSFTWKPEHGPQSQITNPGSCGTGAAPTYEYALFEIEYRYPQSPQDNSAATTRGDPVPFLEHRVTSGGQLITLEQDSSATNLWVWESGQNVPDDVPINVFIGTTQHSVTWPRVPAPNWPNLEQFKGTVNDAAFSLRGYSYPEESLLYLNYDMTEIVMTNGSVAYNLTLHFEGKLVRLTDDTYGGHNHFWNKEENNWERIHKFAATTKGPYRTNNFNNLFISG